MKDSTNNETLDHKISQRLMSSREYQVASYYIPYRYEIRTPRVSVHYFGCRHFQTAENHQFEKVCKAIKEIMPSMVLVEHLQCLHRTSSLKERKEFLDSIAKLTPEEAATQGESELTANLALKLGADLECPEPTDGERFAFLASAGYSCEQIASYYITRAASMYALWKDKMPLDALIKLRVDQLRNSWPWDPSFLTAQVAEDFLQKSFNISLFNSDADTLANLVTPVKIETQSDYTVLNAIGNAVTVFTDVSIVARVIELTEKHDNIFIVFGASHALRQEKALRELLNEEIINDALGSSL